MPRGNAAASVSELADKFGAADGRAEDLIAASRERYSVELETAQLRELDENATALLDKGEVADAAGVKEEQVASAAVRGDQVVAVVSDTQGRTSKVLLELSDFGMEAEEDEAASVVFASDAAEKAADAKNLSAEKIRDLIGPGSGKDNAITTADVKEAAAKA